MCLKIHRLGCAILILTITILVHHIIKILEVYRIIYQAAQMLIVIVGTILHDRFSIQ